MPVDFNNHSSDPDTTLELPLADVDAARRSLEARVDNPGVPPSQPGQPAGPEIENPTETESDPRESNTGPSSRGPAWN
jgi:hypothetical protein